MSITSGDALQDAASSPGRRVPNDGSAYTYAEFVVVFGQEKAERYGIVLGCPLQFPNAALLSLLRLHL